MIFCHQIVIFKLKEFNTKQLLSPVHDKVHVAQRSVRNQDGNHYLIVVGVGAFCKIVIDKTPSYLKNKLPRLRRPLYKQSKRNTFHELKCKSLRYTSSSFPGAITSWNNVINHFYHIPSSSVLKNHILSLIRPKTKMYFWYTLYIYTWYALGLQYLFQLRVTLLIPLLTNVFVIRVLKILITSYFCVFLLLEEQP